MIARLGRAADPAIDARLAQRRRQRRIQQQMVDAQTRIGLPVLPKVIPERVDPFVRIVCAQGIDPSLLEQAPITGAAFGLQQRVLEPGARVIDVLVGRHHVVVAGQHDRMAAVVQRGRILQQPFEPGELVLEFRSRLRVAVGQIQTADQHAMHRGLDVAALLVAVVAGQPTPAFDRIGPARQDCHAVPRFLAVPDRAISGGTNGIGRKTGIGGLQFLQADDIRRLALEPFQQCRQAGANAIDIERGDFQHGDGRIGLPMLPF